MMKENEAAHDPDPVADIAAVPAPEPIAEIIERWWEDHFPGSPVAQVTPAWNHAFAAKEELKQRLAGPAAANLDRGVL
jgi:hypothetical protein